MAPTCKRLRVSLVTLALSAMVVLGSAAGASAGTVGFVGGGAFVAKVNVQPVVGPAVTLGPISSVTLPPTGGGPFTASVASFAAPGLLEARLGSASTQGALGSTGFATSSARLVTISAGGGAVKASLLASSCRVDSAGTTTGTSSFAGLSILGVPVSVSPPPNTTVTLVGVGTLILNEQSTTVGPGGIRSITVNALHLHLAGALGSGDIIISQSRCTARI
jgi:hypothetical protein